MCDRTVRVGGHGRSAQNRQLPIVCNPTEIEVTVFVGSVKILPRARCEAQEQLARGRTPLEAGARARSECAREKSPIQAKLASASLR